MYSVYDSPELSYTKEIRGAFPGDPCRAGRHQGHLSTNLDRLAVRHVFIFGRMSMENTKRSPPLINFLAAC